MQSDSEPKLSDKNARMYQMYFDSSADSVQNELQTRRFIGHLHLADLETIFGDIQSLPMDENCNYIGGPVLDEEGTSWYATITPDLVGVNLVSVTPDGTRSSAFDLDGDRVVDILDMRFSDNRRVSMVTELMGLEVFREWLQGRDPFCNTEVARQLGLPDLGCNERDDGSSGGGGGGFAGSGIIDPIDMLCSEYDTGPRADLMAHNPNRAGWGGHGEQSTITEIIGTTRVTQFSTDYFNDAGEFTGTSRVTTIIDVDRETSAIVEEEVFPEGIGWRVTTTYHSDGTSETVTEVFNVSERDRGKPNYNGNDTRPTSGYPAPQSPASGQGSTSQDNNGGGEQDTQGQGSDSDDDDTWMDQNNPGPEPEWDDSALAELCRRRANHQSGIEQVAENDLTSVSLSCDDLVGAPSNGNCNIIEWARTDDFRGILTPPSADDGCDAFDDPDSSCEGDSIDDQIRRFVGLNAELWSLNLPETNLCPPFLCDPAQSIELQTYSAGGIDFSCNPVITETPTLEPSEENCPPGTYYAPITNRCIEIQIPEGGGNGGNEGGGSSSCNLSAAACTNQGLSFDSNKCECVPIQ